MPVKSITFGRESLTRRV